MATRAAWNINSGNPVGLLEGGKVLKPVRKGELLNLNNAAPYPTTRLYALRKRQDEMLYGIA